MITVSIGGKIYEEPPPPIKALPLSATRSLSPEIRTLHEEFEQREAEREAEFKRKGEEYLQVLLNKVAETFPHLRQWLQSVGLNFSVKGLDYAEEQIARSPTVSTIERVVNELQRRIHDELATCFFVHVRGDVVGSYRKPSLFGDKVATNFPDLAFDIEHAGTCLALEEGTACVMHLMRVLEGAISAIALGTGVPVSAVKGVAAWEALLNLIRDRISDNNKTKVPSWEASRPFFESSLAYLYAVKDAWRNPSMHLEKKYTDIEATRIYNAVKSLMEHLGEHLDQSGKFTA